MANGTTNTFSTQGQWVTVESVMIDDKFSGFTQGKKYNMSCINEAKLRIDGAIFPIRDKDFDFVMGSDEPYIKTGLSDCTLTVLEVEEGE